MDLSKILNQRIAEKISNTQPSADQMGQKLKFDDVLSAKQDSMQDLMQAVMGDTTKSPQVASMDHIKVNLPEGETLKVEGSSSSAQKGMDIFSELNNNYNSMNMAVEVLSDPNTKLSKQELLAYQAGIGNMTVNIELMTKLVQNGVKAVQRFTDMQI